MTIYWSFMRYLFPHVPNRKCTGASIPISASKDQRDDSVEVVKVWTNEDLKPEQFVCICICICMCMCIYVYLYCGRAHVTSAPHPGTLRTHRTWLEHCPKTWAWAVPVVRRASKECLGPVKLTSEPVLVSDFPKFRRQAQNQRGKERQRPVRVTHIVVSVSDLESLAVQVNFLLPDSGPDGQGCTRLPAATATRPSRLAGPEPRRGCGTVSTPSTGTAQEAPPLLQEGQGAATCASLSSN